MNEKDSESVSRTCDECQVTGGVVVNGQRVTLCLKCIRKLTGTPDPIPATYPLPVYPQYPQYPWWTHVQPFTYCDATTNTLSIDAPEYEASGNRFVS